MADEAGIEGNVDPGGFGFVDRRVGSANVRVFTES